MLVRWWRCVRGLNTIKPQSFSFFWIPFEYLAHDFEEFDMFVIKPTCSLKPLVIAMNQKHTFTEFEIYLVIWIDSFWYLLLVYSICIIRITSVLMIFLNLLLYKRQTCVIIANISFNDHIVLVTKKNGIIRQQRNDMQIFFVPIRLYYQLFSCIYQKTKLPFLFQLQKKYAVIMLWIFEKRRVTRHMIS